MSKIGYWYDWTGACHKVEILAETTNGKWVVDLPGLGTSLVDKTDIQDIGEKDAQETM